MINGWTFDDMGRLIRLVACGEEMIPLTRNGRLALIRLLLFQPNESKSLVHKDMLLVDRR